MAAVIWASLGFLALFAPLTSSQTIPDESWNYVTVREDAHMFWWLYGSTGSDRDTRPLVMWLQVYRYTFSTHYRVNTYIIIRASLQGGPGGSSTGFGNFLELGPLDVNLKPRNTTWV